MVRTCDEKSSWVFVHDTSLHATVLTCHYRRIVIGLAATLPDIQTIVSQRLQNHAYYVLRALTFGFYEVDKRFSHFHGFLLDDDISEHLAYLVLVGNVWCAVQHQSEIFSVSYSVDDASSHSIPQKLNELILGLGGEICRSQ